MKLGFNHPMGRSHCWTLSAGHVLLSPTPCMQNSRTPAMPLRPSAPHVNRLYGRKSGRGFTPHQVKELHHGSNSPKSTNDPDMARDFAKRKSRRCRAFGRDWRVSLRDLQKMGPGSSWASRSRRRRARVSTPSATFARIELPRPCVALDHRVGAIIPLCHGLLKFARRTEAKIPHRQSPPATRWRVPALPAPVRLRRRRMNRPVRKGAISDHGVKSLGHLWP